MKGVHRLMRHMAFLVAVLLFKIHAVAQVNCDDLTLNSDSLWVENNKVFSGICEDYSNSHVVRSKFYITNGYEDSVVFYNKNGTISSVEPYQLRKRSGTLRKFYKNGNLKQSIQMQNNVPIGFWREYDNKGKIRFEAEYIRPNELKDDSYYRWTKNGEKYKYTIREFSKSKKIGHFRFDLGTGRRPIKKKVTE